MTDNYEFRLNDKLSNYLFISSSISNNFYMFKITKDVIEDFANENVKYLELRTTPKANTSVGMTKSSYIESVLSAIKDSEVCTAGLITVRIIISIDRGRSLQDAWENLELAKFYRDSYIENRDRNLNSSLIVGIDLSGNPEVNVEINDMHLLYIIFISYLLLHVCIYLLVVNKWNRLSLLLNLLKHLVGAMIMIMTIIII